MGSQEYAKHETISLKGHPVFTEAWLRDKIVGDPAILGLGDLDVVGVEKPQFQGGRLDLVLKDDAQDRLYEVELMLGKLDESHIIRAIEYWDNEQKRYRDYKHCAVIVAEEITGRFFNVISLLNGHIPIIAIQLKALQVMGTEKVILHFTKVLDLVEQTIESPEENLPANRKYFEDRGYKLDAVDACLAMLKELHSGIVETYRRGFIGLSVNGKVDNFVRFHPKREFVRIKVRVEDASTWQDKLEELGFSMLPAKNDGAVRFRLTSPQASKNAPVLKKLFEQSYNETKA